MKKTIFSFAGLAAVALIVLLACTKKENDGAIGVTYASQGAGTGNSGASTSGSTGVVTTTGGTGTTGNPSNTNSMTINGTVSTPTTSCSTVSGFYIVSGVSGANTVAVMFKGTPTTGGSFTIVPGAPTTANSDVSISLSQNGGGTYSATTGTATVTISGGKVKVSFTNLSLTDGTTTYTVSATLQCS